MVSAGWFPFIAYFIFNISSIFATDLPPVLNVNHFSSLRLGKVPNHCTLTSSKFVLIKRFKWG